MEIALKFADKESRELLECIKIISISDFMKTWQTFGYTDGYFKEIEKRVIADNQDFREFMNATSHLVKLFEKKS